MILFSKDPQSPLVRVGDGGSIGLLSESEINIDSSNLRPLPTSKPDVRAIESDLQNEATGKRISIQFLRSILKFHSEF